MTDYLEKALYKNANEKGLITSATTQRSIDKERIPLPKFFDIMSGTSIGGIMASCLSIPESSEHCSFPCEEGYTCESSTEPCFFSDKVTDIGREMTEYSFNKNFAINPVAQVFMWIAGGVLGAHCMYRKDKQ